MKVRIRSISMSKHSRHFIRERTEYIEVDHNALFKSVKELDVHEQALAIEKIYETFWDMPEDNEVVKVIDILIVEK